MRLIADIRYAAGPERVFRMIVDPAFQEAKCEATLAVEHEVEVDEGADGSATVFARRSIPTTGLSEAVRSLIGRTVRLAETQRWRAPGPDGVRRGTITVELEGLPVRFTASTSLTADGEGTHQPIEGDLKASVPLFGGRIESAAEPAVLAAIRVEQRTGTAWLAAH